MGPSVNYLYISNNSLCCKRGSPTHLKVLTYPQSADAGAACAANCTANRRCNFYSTSLTQRRNGAPFRCELCSECTLRRPPEPRTNHIFLAAASWGRDWTGVDDQPHTVSNFVEELLNKHLQGEYSKALYGEPGAMRFDELRVLWLRLLPHRALSILTRVQACQADALPPFHPFFWGLSPRMGLHHSNSQHALYPG